MGEQLNAGEVCNRIVTIATRKMTLVAAAQLMRDHHVGCVVVDESGAARGVVGILTDRDIVTAVIAQEVDPATLWVEDVMTADVVTALEQDSVMDLLGLMRQKGLRRIPIATPDLGPAAARRSYDGRGANLLGVRDSGVGYRDSFLEEARRQ